MVDSTWIDITNERPLWLDVEDVKIPRKYLQIFTDSIEVYAKYLGLTVRNENKSPLLNNNLALIGRRLNKFNEMKFDIKFISPQEFAEAGFFPHSDDKVRSFCCNIILHQWDIIDSPWIEHEKYGDNCPYIALNESRIALRKNFYSKQAVQFVKSVWKYKDIQKLLIEIDDPHRMVTALFHQYKINAKFDYEQIKALFKKINLNFTGNPHINEETRCIVCFNEEKNIVFIPCGHISVCSICALYFKYCCYCRHYVKAYMKVHY